MCHDLRRYELLLRPKVNAKDKLIKTNLPKEETICRFQNPEPCVFPNCPNQTNYGAIQILKGQVLVHPICVEHMRFIEKHGKRGKRLGFGKCGECGAQITWEDIQNHVAVFKSRRPDDPCWKCTINKVTKAKGKEEPKP